MKKYNQGGYLLLAAALISGSALAFLVMESMHERQAAPWASAPAGTVLAQAGLALANGSGP